MLNRIYKDESDDAEMYRETSEDIDGIKENDETETRFMVHDK